ncbi:hypothetical protein [Bifidobacterium moukalabense]|uniref:hypothetical protein n=1 Tax=Bifidobacterium moukalabense TaxID=1333651 RepID=UPI001484EBDE|nr:hypothetical protein [Bifidobacterium moukalabense]
MDEPDNRNNSMKCDSMGDIVSQIFDQIKPQEPGRTLHLRQISTQWGRSRGGGEPTDKSGSCLERFRRFHYKIKLQSTNRTFKKQLSELNETTKLLEETKRRELDCAEREERCDRILDREAVLKTNEAKLKTAHEHLKNEWKHLRESIAEQVKQETDRNANVSGKTTTGSVRGPAHSRRRHAPDYLAKASAQNQPIHQGWLMNSKNEDMVSCTLLLKGSKAKRSLNLSPCCHTGL